MMPPMPNDVPREFLAGYADGELDPASRAAFEQWLAENAGAFEDLQTQREFSPANQLLWESAAPPEPSREQWTYVSGRIEARLGGQGRSRRRAAAWTLAGLATAGIAATVAWFAFHPFRPAAPAPSETLEIVAILPAIAPAPREIANAAVPQLDNSLEEASVLEIATDADVILECMPEFSAGWIVSGRHPVDGPIVLATQEELLVAEFAAGTAWPPGGPKMTTAPGDAPMIFSAKQPR